MRATRSPVTRWVRILVTAGIVLGVAPGCSPGGGADRPGTAAQAQGDPSSRLVHGRAVQAVIWGMPAVNFDLMLQEMLNKTTAKEHEVLYWSRPVDWRNQTLTPNPDAIYLMVFFDLDKGPLVIEVPPAEGGSLAANICTLWQMPLEDAGPFGADQGKGGRYLILPPDYKGRPPGGYIVLRSDTRRGYSLLRSNLASHAQADVEKSVAYGKRIRVYSLSAAASPPETKFTDAREILFDSTIPYDIRFFQSLDRIVQDEPWLRRDMAMIDVLRSIGIEKGKPFAPDAKATEALNAAAAEAREYISQMYDAGFPPFFPNSRWAVPAMPELVKAGASSYAETDLYPLDARALSYSIGYIGIKHLGTAQFYLLTGKTGEGQPLEGAKTYRLHVPTAVPTRQYWSATVYDRETHALVKNLDRASCASNDLAVQTNSDGSVDVYFGAKAPAGKESNWVPTDPNRGFEVLFRLYGPEKALFEKQWTLPDIEEVR